MGRALATLLAAIVAIGLFPWSARAGDGRSVEERLQSLELRIASDGPSILAIVLDCVVALAALGGLAVAIVGLTTWRQQLRGQTEYDLARRLLRSTYRVRDAFNALRAPYMTSNEMASAMKELGVPPEKVGPTDEDFAGTTAAYQIRWRSVEAALSDLKVETLEAEVIWGPPSKAAARSILERASELYTAIRQYIRLKQKEAEFRRRANDLGLVMEVSPARERDDEQLMQAEKLVFGPSDDPELDPFSPKVRTAIEAIEALTRPHLHARRSKRNSTS